MVAIPELSVLPARLALALGLALSVATPVAASSIAATVATSSPVDRDRREAGGLPRSP